MFHRCFANVLHEDICKTFWQMFQHVQNMLKIGMCKMKNLQNICKNVLLVVMSKIKHFYNLFTFTAWPLEVDGSETCLQMM